MTGTGHTRGAFFSFFQVVFISSFLPVKYLVIPWKDGHYHAPLHIGGLSSRKSGIVDEMGNPISLGRGWTLALSFIFWTPAVEQLGCSKYAQIFN